MRGELESPTAGPDSLYRARADEVSPNRPIFTGDVFVGIEVHALGEIKTKDAIVLQHPCSLRTNGVDFHPRLLVAEIRKHKIIEDWTGHMAKMPLPELLITVTSGRRHQAAFFDELYFAAPEQLLPARRAACLSPLGVNLLLQRWVFHNSRVVAETWKVQEVTSGPYEEADLTEEWVDERTLADISAHDAMLEALDWLRAVSANGETRQRMLEDPQKRSPVRQEMRAHLRSLS